MKRKLVLGLCILILIPLGIGLFWLIPREKVLSSISTPRPSVRSGLLLCLVYGNMTSAKDDKKLGIAALGNMIRVRLEAQNVEECKELAISYCQRSLTNGYIPEALGLVIRGQPPTHLSLRFTVSKECVLKETKEE
jgi:hypothetical protein